MSDFDPKKVSSTELAKTKTHKKELKKIKLPNNIGKLKDPKEYSISK